MIRKTALDAVTGPRAGATVLLAAVTAFSLSPVGSGDAAAQPDRPAAPSEQELQERCEAALKDVRTFCGTDLESRFSWPELPNVMTHRVQQPPRRTPNPGSERPLLPRSDKRIECLNARLRVNRYCFRQEESPDRTATSGSDAASVKGIALVAAMFDIPIMRTSPDDCFGHTEAPIVKVGAP